MPGEQGEGNPPQETIRSEGEIVRGLKNSAAMLKTDFLAQRQAQPGARTIDIAQHLDLDPFLQHVDALEKKGALKKDHFKKALITYGSDPIIRFGMITRIARNYDEWNTSPNPQSEKQLRRDLHLGEILGMDQSANNPAFEDYIEIFNEAKSHLPDTQSVNDEQRIRDLTEQLRRTDPASIPDTDTLLNQMLELHNLGATANPDVAALIKGFAQDSIGRTLLNRANSAIDDLDPNTARGLVSIGEILEVNDNYLQFIRDKIAQVEAQMATNQTAAPEGAPPQPAQAERLTKEELDETPGLDMVVLAEQGKLSAEQVISRKVDRDYQIGIEAAIEKYLNDASLEGDFTVGLIRGGVLNRQLPGIAVAIASQGLEILVRNGIINNNARLEGIVLPDRAEAIKPGRRLMGLRGPSEEATAQSEKDRERFSALRQLQTEVLSLYREAMGEPAEILDLFEKQANGEQLSDAEQRILDNEDNGVFETVKERVRSHFNLNPPDWMVVVTETEKLSAAQNNLSYVLQERIRDRIETDQEQRESLLNDLRSLLHSKVMSHRVSDMAHTIRAGQTLGIDFYDPEGSSILHSIDADGQVSREVITKLNQAIRDGDQNTERNLFEVASRLQRRDHPLAGFDKAFSRINTRDYDGTEEFDLDANPSPQNPETPPQGETLAERLAREARERQARGESDD